MSIDSSCGCQQVVLTLVGFQGVSKKGSSSLLLIFSWRSNPAAMPKVVRLIFFYSELSFQSTARVARAVCSPFSFHAIVCACMTEFRSFPEANKFTISGNLSDTSLTGRNSVSHRTDLLSRGTQGLMKYESYDIVSNGNLSWSLFGLGWRGRVEVGAVC